MNGADLKTMTEGLIDDTIEVTLFYQLLNIARVKLEEKKDWEYLKTYDASNSVSSSTTYLTSFSLPTRFRSVAKLYVGDDSDNSYVGVMFEERQKYQDSGSKYYIDYANDNFSVMGNFDEGGTIHMFYLQYGEDVEEATEPTFPDRFQPILAFMVAGYYTAGVDADDIYARMSPAHRFAAEELRISMNAWDNKLKMNMLDYSSASNVPMYD